MEAKKQIELARELGVDPHTIKRNKKKYLEITYIDANTKYGPRGYGVRYIEVKEVLEYLKKQGILPSND